MKAKFYICNHCGNLVTTIHNAGVPLVCCGEKMKELVPNTVEASGEKHLPVAELSGSRLTVTVGQRESGQTLQGNLVFRHRRSNQKPADDPPPEIGRAHV